MKIQLGTIYINKTKKYLLPCLSEYGQDFVLRIVKLYKLAIGIGDFALIDMGITLEKHIFILIDTKLSRNHFNSTMNWLRLQDYFSFEYAFDDIHTGHLHMVAIEIPKKYYRALDKFKEGKYSKMYTSEEVAILFKNKNQELKIFTREGGYVVEFVEKVNKLYNTNVSPETWEGELDFPIKQEEENF